MLEFVIMFLKKRNTEFCVKIGVLYMTERTLLRVKLRNT